MAATLPSHSMGKSNQPPTPSEQTLEVLLDKVAIAREQLTSIERTVERLRADITKGQKQKDGAGKIR
jgi:hypothetical protein